MASSSSTGPMGAPGGRMLNFPSMEKVKRYPPSLVETCLRKISTGFLRFDPAVLQRELTRAKQLEEVYAILDTDIPLGIAATWIDDEYYWKRRTLQRDKGEYTGLVDQHGMSWKQFFCETELGFIIEKFPLDFEAAELDELKSIVQAVKQYIFCLKIREYPSHFDLALILDPLPNLCSLQITYGRKRLGMEYERGLFGMKIVDAQYLVRYVRCCQTLVKLSLPCNMIDDELAKILMQGLETCLMLTDLDLSGNNLGDRGARRLAKLLHRQYVLQTLDLSDNAIHANGCMHLGAHLAENSTLETLNLRLNRCEDNGVCHLLQDLCINKTLRNLNLSSNDLTWRCLAYLSSMISENGTLEYLDLSANTLWNTEEGEETKELTDVSNLDPESPFGILVQCVSKNSTLLSLDVRHCSLPEDLERRLHTITKHRELRSRGISVDAYERAGLLLQQPVEEEKPAAAPADGDDAEKKGTDESEENSAEEANKSAED
ncbi:unnamed protein product [Amoebophrya sp. A120]|nr:unnamed protein product [Amoebophrya sp. A120]|eukprot:GSA120T00017854001.1